MIYSTYILNLHMIVNSILTIIYVVIKPLSNRYLKYYITNSNKIKAKSIDSHKTTRLLSRSDNIDYTLIIRQHHQIPRLSHKTGAI